MVLRPSSNETLKLDVWVMIQQTNSDAFVILSDKLGFLRLWVQQATRPHTLNRGFFILSDKIEFVGEQFA